MNSYIYVIVCTCLQVNKESSIGLKSQNFKSLFLRTHKVAWWSSFDDLCDVFPVWPKLTTTWLVSLLAVTGSLAIFTVRRLNLQTMEEETAII